MFPASSRDSHHCDGLDRPVPATALLARAIAEGSTRHPFLNRAGKITSIDRLIEAHAWTDAALALIELQLPQWQLRRLAHEEGKWLCRLSRQRGNADGMDVAVDGRHELLPLAILGAFFAAQQQPGS
jgi:hypothetical protein